MGLKKKVFTDAHQLMLSLSSEDKTVVWTNGCFDLLHSGHLNSLKQASELGDLLIVGLNSDSSVQKLKGLNRPIFKQTHRAHLLGALIYVDAILVFDELTPANVLEVIKPDVFAKGADYDLSTLPEASVVQGYGGRLVSLDLVDDISTTDIINRIKTL